MDRKPRVAGEVGIWSEIIGESESEEQQSTNTRIQPIYHRRRRPPPHTHTTPSDSEEVEPPNNRNRLSLAAANKRVSWNRSLSTRFLLFFFLSYHPHIYLTFIHFAIIALI